MKKFGQLFISFLPCILMLAIQYVVMFGVLIYEALRGENVFLSNGDGLIELFTTNSEAIALNLVISELAMLLFFGIYFFSLNYHHIANPFKQFSLASIPMIMLLFLALEMVVSTGLVFINRVKPDLLQEYEEAMQFTIGDMSLGIMIAALVIAPMAEELVFRGVTLKYLQRFTSHFWLANILQAILFGVVHMNVVQGIYAFCLGLVLGCVRRRYDTLWASVIGHVTFNVCGTILVAIIYGDNMPVDSYAYMLMILMIAIAVISAVVYWMSLEKKGKSGKESFDKSHQKIYSFANDINETMIKTGE